MSEERITQLLLKVKELAERGVDGEREVAAEKLRALMTKHGLTPEDLASDTREWIAFRVPKDADNLFVNIVCEIRGVARFNYRQYRDRKVRFVDVELTPAENIDLRAAWAHYSKIYDTERRRLRRELRLLAAAINARFGIADNVPDEPRKVKSKERSDEERAALLAVLHDIRGKRFHKPRHLLPA